MQEFIDKEIDKNVEFKVVSHIESCKECSSLYHKVSEDKALVNNFFNKAEFTGEGAIIPEFKRPDRNKMKFVTSRLVLVLAAASLIGIILFFYYEGKPVTEKMPEADLIMYEFLDGKDLNKLWHDKSQILILQDSQGNVIQSSITY
jgi:hypothetical protein